MIYPLKEIELKFYNLRVQDISRDLLLEAYIKESYSPFLYSSNIYSKVLVYTLITCLVDSKFLNSLQEGSLYLSLNLFI